MRELIINLLPALGLSLAIQLFMHEIGHMIGGIITGWRFIYIQFFHLAILKEKNKIKIRYITTSGLQCIMYPKTIEKSSDLYTLGGCIMNLVLTVISLIFMVYKHDRVVIWFYSWCFFMFGVMMLAMNAIPNTKRVCNDMACYLLLKRDNLTKRCHNAQLMIAKRLSDGCTYRKIETELSNLTEVYVNNDILAYQAVLEYYYGLDTNDYKLMKSSIEKIDNNAPISQGVRNIIQMELLYKDMYIRIKNHDTSPMDITKYGGNIEGYIKLYMTKGDVHSIRVKTTYEVYENYSYGDIAHALQIIEKGIKEISSIRAIYPGEVFLCIGQLNQLSEYFESNIFIDEKVPM